MKILTTAQMREVDRRTSAERGIPSLTLMENAGMRVYEFLAERFAPLKQHRIAILCGKGNNGGDGMVVARQLHMRRAAGRLQVVLACDPKSLTGDAAANYRMLHGVECQPRAVTSERDWEAVFSEMLDCTLVVDALLGTGLRGPAEGLFLRIIRDVNARLGHSRIVAVDIPSGMPGDTGERLGEAMRADQTITFTASKIAQIFPPNCDAVGELRVVPIGSAPSLYEDDPAIFLSTIDPDWIAPLFAPRPSDSHKGDFGHVLIVAGSTPKPGAAILAGTAAMRAGAGLVTVATTGRAAPVVPAHTPELMTEPLPESEHGTVSGVDEERLDSMLARKNVMAIGPGLGTNDEARTFMQKAIDRCRVRVVLDADALTPQNIRAGAVMTPHPAEMARLTGLTTADIQRDRIGVARCFAQERGVYLVLKGYRTLLGLPDGRVFVNLTGTPALASGGTGDVLTGMIAGCLAQFPNAPVQQAVAAAVHLHGLAGQMAVRELGEQATMATDVIARVGAAIAAVRNV